MFILRLFLQVFSGPLLWSPSIALHHRKLAVSAGESVRILAEAGDWLYGHVSGGTGSGSHGWLPRTCFAEDKLRGISRRIVESRARFNRLLEEEEGEDERGR